MLVIKFLNLVKHIMMYNFHWLSLWIHWYIPYQPHRLLIIYLDAVMTPSFFKHLELVTELTVFITTEISYGSLQLTNLAIMNGFIKMLKGTKWWKIIIRSFLFHAGTNLTMWQYSKHLNLLFFLFLLCFCKALTLI